MSSDGNLIIKKENDHGIDDHSRATISRTDIGDEDIYEDTGDLDFQQASRDLLLTRIPRYLWKHWSRLGEDEEIHLGTIRVEGGLDKPQRMSLLLKSDLAVNKSMPKEYNIQTTNPSTANIFVFHEKDLPGYTRPQTNSRHLQGNLPGSRLNPEDKSSGFQAKVDKGRRYQQYYRKAIPKRTSIAGFVRKELNCLPVENSEYQRIMDERSRQESKPKLQTKVLEGPVSSHAGTLLIPGSLGTSGGFNTFIKTSTQSRSKPQESKAARMPQNELLDHILECFKQYTYWHLKTLKHKLKQPEAYLKQTLELVAQLVRQGPHAMTWQLKPEVRMDTYEDSISASQHEGEQAPENGFGYDGASDSADGGGSEDDENVKMEEIP